MVNRCLNNFPCPIFCPLLMSCQNIVVNPDFNDVFAFFANSTASLVASGSLVPLNFLQGQGDGISSNGLGAINLIAGNYQITYFANITSSQAGNLGLQLQFNNAVVPLSNITSTVGSGETTTLTQTIVTTFGQSGTLQLVNSSSFDVTVNSASVLIKRL